jgi:hypothetical protein
MTRRMKKVKMKSLSGGNKEGFDLRVDDAEFVRANHNSCSGR